MSSAAAETAGVVTRMANCSAHGLFPQVLFPAVPGQQGFWAGLCDTCSKEEALRQQARQRIEARRGEIDQRVNERMAKLEKAIQKETKERIEDYLREVREEVAPQFDDWVRSEIWKREEREIENDLVEQEIAKMKKGE
jgi:hypothetical protein